MQSYSLFIVGMLLSIYDMGVRQLVIYGPEGLCDYFITMQLFLCRWACMEVAVML